MKRSMQEPTFLILTALAAGPQHGYAIITDAGRTSGGVTRLQTGTLYMALDRLCSAGLVEPDREEVADGRLRRYYRLTDEGAALLQGGVALAEGAHSKGHFFAPTIFGKVQAKMRIAQEEVFGPVLSIIECDGVEDAIRIANGIEYGLSTALYSRDVNKAFRAIRDLEAGITYVNAPTIGAEVHLPFGGVKQTGNGHREGGTGALDFYTTWKSVYIDYSDKLQRAQIDNAD